MEELMSKIIYNSLGIFDNFFDFSVPFKQKTIKEIDFDKDIIYLRVLDNKLYPYIFEPFDYSYAHKVDFNHRDDLIALELSNWIYNSNYYRSSFNSLTYSMYYNLRKDVFINFDTKINVYGYNYIPKEYYVLKKQDSIYNIKIISHILYKSEISDFIRKYDYVNNNK
jgi:hypothetical protein